MHGRSQLLLIRRKSANMITACCRQFGGEDVCTHNGETCSSADGWAGRVAGISYECDSASTPAIHHDGANRIKVYVVGVLQFREQARHFPIHVAEQGAYQSSLRRDIVAIVIVQRGGPPQQDDPRLPGLANRIDRSCTTDIRIAQHSLIQVEIVGNCEHGKVATQEVQELVFLTERQPTSNRV